jgi:hypothetical protein
VYEQLIIDIYSMRDRKLPAAPPLRRETNLSYTSCARMVWVGVLWPSIHRPHVHGWWCRILNRLIRVFVESSRDAFATLAAAARIYTATHDGKHEHETTEEDVWPITLDGALNVLFLLARRQWGVRFLRGGEERLRCRTCRVCTVEADIDKIGVCTGGISYRE